MHDLNTINRLNYEAFAGAIEHYRAQGRHVLAKYEGTTLVSIETFSTADEIVDAHSKQLEANTGQRLVCYAPLPTESVIGRRDQSEDRQAAERTLGDYVARKSY